MKRVFFRIYSILLIVLYLGLWVVLQHLQVEFNWFIITIISLLTILVIVCSKLMWTVSNDTEHIDKDNNDHLIEL
jgi:Na+/melibiose symporter-like transporter